MSLRRVPPPRRVQAEKIRPKVRQVGVKEAAPKREEKAAPRRKGKAAPKAAPKAPTQPVVSSRPSSTAAPKGTGTGKPTLVSGGVDGANVGRKTLLGA